jgi:putative transposase
VSTRKVEKVFSKFGFTGISASEVSRIAKRLDKQVKEFFNRPIERSIPYLFANASYFKVRTDGRYINKALLVVTGIREDGYREILSAKVADSEDESCWESCFEDLKARGLSDVRLVISDGHKRIQAAVKKVFVGASWQMCNVHFMRAVLKNISKKDKKRGCIHAASLIQSYNRHCTKICGLLLSASAPKPPIPILLGISKNWITVSLRESDQCRK